MTIWGSSQFDVCVDGEGARRRDVLTGILGVGAFALTGGAFARSALAADTGADVEAVRNLMRYSSERAFAWLMQPDGFWTSAVARIPVPQLFTPAGQPKASVLRSPEFMEKLQHHLNTVAGESVDVVVPQIEPASRRVPITNARGILNGTNTAATTVLRKEVGPGLVNRIIPSIQKTMEEQNDPTLAQAISALKGVKIADAAKALALNADNAIWYEIGSAEAAIREDPSQTNDAKLIAALARA